MSEHNDDLEWQAAYARIPTWHRREIEHLVAAYGSPRYRHIHLDDGRFDPLTKTDRVGEVGMVIRRPDGTLITARKTYYPPGVFRLLTGGIGHSERIIEALNREVLEETSLTVRINRFLSTITYQLDTSAPRFFVSYVFLIDELAGTLRTADPTEQVAEFRSVLPTELPLLAAQLRQLADRSDAAINGKWSSWGRFRAVMHEECAAALIT